ncbi:MAG TPA: UDP-glucose 4-epimerase GalE [Candidatus Obscuribacterales bacterium]
MILVTGGAGYVGSHFVHRYLKERTNEEVVVVDDLSEGHKEAIANLDRIHPFFVDMGDFGAMVDIFRRFPVTQVVHFAGSCYVGESEQVPRKYFSNNVINSLNLLSAMEECGVRQIVFSSTCSTYGIPQQLPLVETHPQEPINTYGLTKLMIEKAIQTYGRIHQWSYVLLRYFNAAGADDSGLIGESHAPETHLIPLALKAALDRTKPLTVFGTDYDTRDGTCIRDYIHVCDLADAHIRALELIESNGYRGELNMGTSHGASVKEVIQMCKEVTGMEIPVEYGPRRAGDPAVLTADPSLAERILHVRAKYDLRSIIETAWNWETNRRY